VEVHLPGNANVRWCLIIDTAREEGFVDGASHAGTDKPHRLGARALTVFQQASGSDPDIVATIQGK
jgi:hypothetical protein